MSKFDDAKICPDGKKAKNGKCEKGGEKYEMYIGKTVAQPFLISSKEVLKLLVKGKVLSW